MTLNDHLRNLLDEIPGVAARDFVKAWNREQRTIAQERRWRDLRCQYQFALGASSSLGRVKTSLPYSTGTVTGSAGGSVLTGVGTAWLGGWNGLESTQIIVGETDIYDVLSVDNFAQTITVWPTLRTSYSGNQYSIHYVAAALLPSDVMGIRGISRLDATSREEEAVTQPEDYRCSRVVNGSPWIEFQNEEDSSFILHYYKWPTAITTMAQTIDLPSHVQDVIYCRLLSRYIGKTPMDIQSKGFLHAEAKQRAASAMRSAVSADETQEYNQGVNHRTLWTPGPYSTDR